MRTPTAREEDNMCLKAQKTGLTKEVHQDKPASEVHYTDFTQIRAPRARRNKTRASGSTEIDFTQESTAKNIRLKVKKQQPHPKESTHQKSKK